MKSLPAPGSSEDLAGIFDVVLMHAAACARYQPSACDDVVDVYVTDFESRSAQTLAYWRSMPAAAVVSRLIPGDHTAVVELPGAAEVAGRILARIRLASAAAPPGRPRPRYVREPARTLAQRR